LFAGEHDPGEDPDQPGPKFALMKGILGGAVPLFVFVIYVYIHWHTSFQYVLYRKNVEKARKMG
jgi:hypothetical protein